MTFNTQAMFGANSEGVYMNCGCLVCQGKTDLFSVRLDDAALADAGAGLIQTSLAPVATESDATVPGSLSGTEPYDLIAVHLEAGTTYSFAYRGAPSGGIEDPYLALFGPGFAYVTEDDDGGAGRSSMITFTATESGTHYLYATSWYTLAFGDPAIDTGAYTIDIWAADPANDVPDTLEGAVTIDTGTTFGHIETSGDVDLYRIDMTAGQVYTFGFSGGVAGSGDFDGEPGEVIAYLDLLDADGNEVATALNYETGLGFFAEESGTYYLKVSPYLADMTGGYTLDVAELNPADYDPLDSLNWGSADNVQFVDVNGTPTAYVYFGDSDENFNQTADDGVSPMITFDWNDFEKQQVMEALEEYEKILGVDYQITDDVDQATFRLLKTESEQYGAYFFPQDPAYGPDQGVGVFNILSGGWSFDQQQSLLRGGFSFAVILHEFGHAHGLSHPHDTGGGSDIMLAVNNSGSLGVFNLNQGVYTVMSYNDAWQLHPDGPSPFTAAGIDNGWSASLGAFDIAALQARYGVHAANTGNDVYQLQDANDLGTFYETIWDTGGTDEIRYGGARDVQIDLTAATLDYTPTGGGVVSFVDDIWGGYTIANGVVIENATGGSGNDVLIGNGAANVITGNAGDDFMMGKGGRDTFNGGAGTDTVSYRTATSGVQAQLNNNGTGQGTGGEANGDRYTSVEALEGSEFADRLQGNSRADILIGLGGDDHLEGGNGNDDLDGGDGNDRLDGGNGNDSLTGGAGDDRLEGENGNDVLLGGDGNDRLIGGNGNDRLDGGDGDDVLIAGNGKDLFAFGHGGVDTIVGYQRGEKIDLSALTGVDESDVTISRGRIFVENGDDDLTILIQGDAVRMGDILFFSPGAASAPLGADQSFA